MLTKLLHLFSYCTPADVQYTPSQLLKEELQEKVPKLCQHRSAPGAAVFCSFPRVVFP